MLVFSYIANVCQGNAVWAIVSLLSYELGMGR